MRNARKSVKYIKISIVLFTKIYDFQMMPMVNVIDKHIFVDWLSGH